MTINIEREKNLSGFDERANEATPLTIEKKEVVTPTPSSFKAQVSDDQGNPLISTPPVSVVNVTVPYDDAKLTELRKGDTGDSLTWLAVFLQRLVQKALHFGWRIIGRN